MTDIRKYIDIVENEWLAGQLFEMANVTSRYHGIENVVIWVGRSPKQHGLRIKVSKIPNKMDVENSFVIMMPSLDYDPGAVPKWMSSHTVRQILDWIKLNQKLLNDYENGLIDDTGHFLDSISKIKE